MKIRIQLMLAIGAVLVLLLPRAGSAQESMPDGFSLWSQNCGRCHNFRAIEERYDAEWAVIVAHMRARANLTKSAAEAILTFLQSSAPRAGASANREDAVAAGSSGTPSDLAWSLRTTADAPLEVDWASLLAVLGARVILTP